MSLLLLRQCGCGWDEGMDGRPDMMMMMDDEFNEHEIQTMGGIEFTGYHEWWLERRSKKWIFALIPIDAAPGEEE